MTLTEQFFQKRGSVQRDSLHGTPKESFERRLVVRRRQTYLVEEPSSDRGNPMRKALAVF